MNKPALYRKRLIPFETTDISGDELLYRDENLIVTRWKAIKTRPDFSHGISFAFLDRGYKISRFYDSANNFLYWYCDIIEVHYNRDNDSYVLLDLLVDIKLMTDGKLVVLDMDELADAMERGLITGEQAAYALRVTDGLLKMIYSGIFPPEICKNNEY